MVAGLMREGGIEITASALPSRSKTGQDGFGAFGYYIDVRQCKGADYLAEEGSFLVIRFDERQVNFGGPDFYRKSGESGAGAEIDDAGRRCCLS